MKLVPISLTETQHTLGQCWTTWGMANWCSTGTWLRKVTSLWKLLLLPIYLLDSENLFNSTPTLPSSTPKFVFVPFRFIGILRVWGCCLGFFFFNHLALILILNFFHKGFWLQVSSQHYVDRVCKTADRLMHRNISQVACASVFCDNWIGDNFAKSEGKKNRNSSILTNLHCESVCEVTHGWSHTLAIFWESANKHGASQNYLTEMMFSG